MNNIILKLYRLQQIEMGPEPDTAENQTLIKKLRAEIPEPIVRHYDRIRGSGKTGVALVKNFSCSGCHMSVTIGDYNKILAGDDLTLCQHCGRYLIVLEEEVQKSEAEPLKAETPAPEPIKPAKSPKKRARRKKDKSE